MPFDRFAPCTFSLVSVQRNAPALSGVYGLSNAREWIFVGESDNIKAALLQHLQERHAALLERGPTGFVYELCIPHDRLARQERLIQEYQPVFHGRPR
jgi:excinuclease UvrABC nuclease subunit